jgi:hypothetical protein
MRVEQVWKIVTYFIEFINIDFIEILMLTNFSFIFSERFWVIVNNIYGYFFIKIV